MIKVYKVVNQAYEECEMKDIRKGDVFKMYEANGEEVINEHNETVFHAISDAYVYENNIWMVDVE